MSVDKTGIAAIAEALLNHINTWDDKPQECKMSLEPCDGALMLQPQPGAAKIQTYIDGSYRGQWPFAVYLRLQGKGTRKKLDAFATLNALGAWLENTEIPPIDTNITAERIEALTLPAQAYIGQDGTEDFRISLRLVYFKKEEDNA